MRGKILTFFLIAISVSQCFGFGLSFGEDGGIDVRIIAVVGNRPILSTELDQTVLAMGYQLPKDSSDFYQLYASVLQDLINEELIYQSALEESLEIDDATIQSEFSARWDSLVAKYGGEKNLADTLAKEGLSISEFKHKVKEQVRTGMLKQLYIQKHIGFVEISDEDVKKFYEQNKDSLGEYPAQAHLYAILIAPPDDSLLWMSALRRANDIIEKLNSGERFAEVAEKFSDDPATKSLGGKIGKFALADLPENFRNAVEKMKTGEHSMPIKGDEGYHILKLLSRKDNTVEIAHIFLKKPSPQEGAHQIALSIYDSLKAGADFSDFVKKYSADSISAEAGGEVGWYPLSYIEQVASLLDSSSDIGVQSSEDNEAKWYNKILPPIPEQNGWVIYRISGIKSAEPLNLETHGDIIREMARRDAFNKKLKKILKNLREQIFVEIRDEKIKEFMKE
ncbi:hypothetical protein DRQ26_04720 [bacterium]|nr:MAG: hypothetical protein DRQ26_04720 [bacterium]